MSLSHLNRLKWGRPFAADSSSEGANEALVGVRAIWPVVVGVAWMCCCSDAVNGAGTTINEVDRHAYGANIGWIDARGDGESGASVGEYVCSGYVYAANVGWINLGDGAPADGVYYRNDSADDFGVNRDPLGRLAGLAWGANIGWIVFTNRTATGQNFEPPQVDLLSGRFSGYAYASNAGWISLSNMVAHVKTDAVLPGADSDGDGIPDPWEFSHVGNLIQMTGLSDFDQDSASDLEEYRADTDPLSADDALRILGFEPAIAGTQSTITWSSKPTRVYRVEKRLSWEPGFGWEDSGLGVIRPDEGATTTRTVHHSLTPERYLRLRAEPPLSP